MRKNNRDASREGLIEDRRARVASCKVQGMSIRQTIAALAQAGCVNPDSKKPWAICAIKSDLDALTARWQAEALRDISQAKADELAKLDELEREAWQAWHRGIGRKQVRTTKTGGANGAEVSLRTETLNGDPRYLAIVMDCQQRRSKLLGLDAPQRLEASGPDGGPLQVQNMSDAELLAIVEKAATNG